MSQAVKNHIGGTATDMTVKTKVENGSIIKLSGSGTVVKGDIIEIVGTSYAVLQDVTLATTGVDVMLSKELTKVIEGSTQVSKIPSHTANLAFNKNAFAFVTRPLEKAYGAESYVINYEGLTLRITMDYDIATKKQILSVDTLYGFKTMYEELAVRVLG